MVAKPYSHILQQVQQLPPDEQRQLLADLVQLVQQTNEQRAQPTRSILELDGLGKEIWEGVDPDRYIEEERRSWDG